MKKATTELTLDALLARNYGVRLWWRDGRVIAEIEELSLVAEAESVAAALDALDGSKRDYFAALHRLGRATEIPLPLGESAARAFWLQHRSFCFKVLFGGLVAGLLLLAIVPAFKLQVHGLKRELQITGRALPNGMFEGIENFRAMPEERQQRAAAGVRTFIEALAPVIKEGKAALEDEGIIQRPPNEATSPDGQ